MLACVVGYIRVTVVVRRIMGLECNSSALYHGPRAHTWIGGQDEARALLWWAAALLVLTCNPSMAGRGGGGQDGAGVGSLADMLAAPSVPHHIMKAGLVKVASQHQTDVQAGRFESRAPSRLP